MYAEGVELSAVELGVLWKEKCLLLVVGEAESHTWNTPG